MGVTIQKSPLFFPNGSTTFNDPTGREFRDGDRPGGHVVQAYVTRPDPDGVDRFLAGFTRVEAGPGQRVPAALEVPLSRLAVRGEGTWRLLPGSYRLDVGGHAADPDAVAVTMELPG